MPNSCLAYGCKHRYKKGSGIIFHRLPHSNPVLLKKWLVKISRDDFTPGKYHFLCSEHFPKEDYMRGIHPREEKDITHHYLLPEAVPTIFPGHPPHKQSHTLKRPAPKPRMSESSPQPPPKKASDVAQEHGYCSSVSLDEKLEMMSQQLHDSKEQLRVIKQKVKRKDEKISSFLKEVKEKELISQDQHDLLQLNFGESAYQLLENELRANKTDKHGHQYSEELKKFAVTLHFYSSQAYDFLRTNLHLPHPSTIRRWGAGINCQPGFQTEVIAHLKEMVESDHIKAHCVLMLDAMAIKKEVVFDQKTGSYSGFVDCGNFLPTDDDKLATEALVFMVVGLTNHWKFPVAYYLVDHLPGKSQAEIIKQLICSLTEAGLRVHGIVSDGSYANQTTATLMGCTISAESLKPYFSHPLHPDEKVFYVFDACHLVKLVRNCLATMGTIYHDDEPISWSYIEKLHEIQQKDNLNLANKLKAKHVQWEKQKMNVKVAVQALSSSVADAIDFLREDLHLPQFAGSQKTTEFIRIIDKLFDFMNSKSCKAKGYKKPMNLSNLTARTNWLLETKSFLAELRDNSGQPLTKSRRKTAWLGFMTSIESIVQICHDLLLTAPQPFAYFCTYKMSQDHLEMFFSRVRRRAGWNNNPNAQQFKWALRAILQKNSIAPSKNANVTMEEPSNRLFLPNQSPALCHSNPDMQKLAKLLDEPSDFHEHVLHYVAGYVSRHTMNDCTCTPCCVALYKNSATFDAISDHSYSADGSASAFTRRKDRGGLVKPADDVYKIVKTTDHIFRRALVSHGPMKTSNRFIKEVQGQVLASVREQVFMDLEDHFYEQNLASEDDHGNQLVKKISGLFLRTLLYHHGRLFTERYVKKNKSSERHLLTKKILFLGE